MNDGDAQLRVFGCKCMEVLLGSENVMSDDQVSCVLAVAEQWTCVLMLVYVADDLRWQWEGESVICCNLLSQIWPCVLDNCVLDNSAVIGLALETASCLCMEGFTIIIVFGVKWLWYFPVIL